ncbi:MAG: hypothetical protein WCF84_11145 [Anaerolineae bacterium]
MPPNLTGDPIYQLRELVRAVPFQDLVLIAGTSTNDQFLLVYNTDTPPSLPEDLRAYCKVCDLHNLKEERGSTFIGWAAGFPAMHLFAPDLAAPGPMFINLFSILPRKIKNDPKQRQALAHTMFQLSRALYAQVIKSFWPEPASLSGSAPDITPNNPIYPGSALYGERERAISEFFQLALPYLLANLECKDVVAIFPDPNVENFLNPTQPGLALVRISDLKEQAILDALGKQQWVIGLAQEELSLLTEMDRVTDRHWIDLAPILTWSGTTGTLTLRDTRHALACDLYNRSLETEQEALKSDLLKAAFRLEALCHRTGEKDPGLVAVIPPSDFSRFCTGEELRVYRAPANLIPRPVFSATPPASVEYISLEDLASKSPTGQNPHSASYSFEILDPLLRKMFSVESEGLGQLFEDGDQLRELVWNLWFFSQDLLDLKGDKWGLFNASPSAITDMAARAVYLHNVLDPGLWPSLKEYEDSLRQCYENLLSAVLNEQERIKTKEPERAVCLEAFGEWYRCYSRDNIQRNLENLVQKGSAVNDRARANGSYCFEQVQEVRRIAEQLIGWHPADASGRERHDESAGWFQQSRYPGQIANAKIPLAQPSPYFNYFYQEYLNLTSRWHQLKPTLFTENSPALEILEEILAAYLLLEKRTFGPAHETAILSWAYQADIKEINQMRGARKRQPYLQLTLRNPYTTPGVCEEVHFDVENIGSRTAFHVQLTLERSPDFKLTSHESQPTENLAPGERRRVWWKIEPTANEMNLSIQCRFIDSSNVSYEQALPRVHVPVFPNQVRGKPTGQPYFDGRAVWKNDLFIGRNTEMRALVDNETASRPMIIYIFGPRRIGKTSLLLGFERLPGDLVQQDKFGIPPEQRPRLNQIKTIRSDIQELSTLDPNPTATFLRELCHDIYNALHEKWDAAREREDFEQSPAKVFKDKVKRLLDNNSEAILVMLVDEWDELYRKEFGNVLSNLRSIMQVHERVGWIFTSTWATTREAAYFGSATFGLHVPYEIGPMNRGDSNRLVLELGAKANVNWRGEAVYKVVEEAGCWPYLVQLICFKVVAELRAMPDDTADFTVTPQLVEKKINDIIREVQKTNLYFGYLWKGPEESSEESVERMHWMGRLVLWCLVEHPSSSLTFPEIEAWIRGKLDQAGEPLASDVRDFVDELREELKKLHIAFGAVRVEQRVHRTDRSQPGGGSASSKGPPSAEETEPLYSLAVPLVQRWLTQVVQQEKNLIQLAYPEILRDLEEQKRKREQRAKRDAEQEAAKEMREASAR